MKPALKTKMLRNLRLYIQREKSEHNDKLMPHQIETLERTGSFLSKPKGTEYGIAFTANPEKEMKEETGRKLGDFFEIISATGTGKTREFGCLAKACDVPALILTPRNVINNQTKLEFCKEIGINPDEVGVYDSKQLESAKKRALTQKYLITTYQSLPALLKNGANFADEEGANYRPLVVLDEAHKGQGNQQSQAVKAFLHKCIVAGFTATDAGAKDTLFEGQEPIVKLGIVPAIKDDLLCEGVRTGVIDVNINEEWLRDFSAIQKGRDYRQEDVHKFATNPAIVKGAIDFHLMQDDEQLGQLHRLPTIFFTQGIDAAQMGAKLFNEEAQRLGVEAKADFISGEMDAKERDAKLEKFKNGEIQALWNDSVLEMGFNDKNATVCYSLKPSVMTHVVEQQMGRIARKPEKYYAAKYGQSKLALAINVRAPGMNPFLFGEVLGGVPAVYSTAHPPAPKRPKKPTRGKEWPDDITVHIDYDDMHEVLSEATKRDMPLYADRTDEWLTAVHLEQSVKGLHARNLQELFRAAKTVLEPPPTHPKEERVLEYKGEFFRVAKRNTGKDSHACLHKDEIDKICTVCGVPPLLRKPWLSRTEVADSLEGISLGNAVFLEFSIAANKAYPNRQNKTKLEMDFVYKGQTVRIAGRFPTKSSRTTAICYHEDDLGKIGLICGIPPRQTKEWSTYGTIKDVIKYPGFSSERVASLRKRAEAAFTTFRTEHPATYDYTYEENGQQIRMAYRLTDDSYKVVCFHNDDVPKIMIAAEVPLRKELPWCSSTELRIRKNGMQPQDPAFKRFEAEAGRAYDARPDKSKHEHTFNFHGPTIHISRRLSASNELMCYLMDDRDRIIEGLREELALNGASHTQAEKERKGIGRSGSHR